MKRIYTVWSAGELTKTEENKVMEALKLLGIDPADNVVSITVEQVEIEK
jgi:hypothetical protein